jgi:hypothetical protein
MAGKPLTAKQKERENYGRTSVASVVQPSQTKKAKPKPTTATTNIHKQSEIEIHHWLNYNSEKIGDIIKQLENIQKGLRQVASLVRAHYILR